METATKQRRSQGNPADISPDNPPAKVRSIVPLEAYDVCGIQPVEVGTVGRVDRAYYSQAEDQQYWLVSWPQGLAVMDPDTLAAVTVAEPEEIHPPLRFAERLGLRQRLACIARTHRRSDAARQGWDRRRAGLAAGSAA